jgi:hypothetical protein
LLGVTELSDDLDSGAALGEKYLENRMILTERAWSNNEISPPKNGEAAWKVLFGNSLNIAKKQMKGKLKEQWLFINPDTDPLSA